jgi:hypothetical protein
MKQPTRARLSLPLLLIPTLWLASCGSSEETKARVVVLPRVGTALSEPTPAARKATIRAQLAALCPTPLSGDELEWAAEFVEENRSKGAVWLTGRLLKMHRESQICRGGPVGGQRS